MRPLAPVEQVLVHALLALDHLLAGFSRFDNGSQAVSATAHTLGEHFVEHGARGAYQSVPRHILLLLGFSRRLLHLLHRVDAVDQRERLDLLPMRRLQLLVRHFLRLLLRLVRKVVLFLLLLEHLQSLRVHLLVCRHGLAVQRRLCFHSLPGLRLDAFECGQDLLRHHALVWVAPLRARLHLVHLLLVDHRGLFLDELVAVVEHQLALRRDGLQLLVHKYVDLAARYSSGLGDVVKDILDAHVI